MRLRAGAGVGIRDLLAVFITLRGDPFALHRILIGGIRRGRAVIFRRRMCGDFLPCSRRLLRPPSENKKADHNQGCDASHDPDPARSPGVLHSLPFHSRASRTGKPIILSTVIFTLYEYSPQGRSRMRHALAATQCLRRRMPSRAHKATLPRSTPVAGSGTGTISKPAPKVTSMPDPGP